MSELVSVTTYSGLVIPIYSIEQWDIVPGDIAHSLAYQCRFNGHTNRFYSVAEHSMLIASYVDKQREGQNLELRLAALLHDAQEAYIGDIIEPIQETFGIRYSSAEQGIVKAICKAFCIDPDLMKEIRLIDQVACVVEGYYLIGGMYWHKLYNNRLRKNKDMVRDLSHLLRQNEHAGPMWEQPEEVSKAYLSDLMTAFDLFSINSTVGEETC